ncbi:MAG: hypothetical protein GY950_01280 [bacterium]|nr:hypothetical protein [bacterium]
MLELAGFSKQLQDAYYKALKEYSEREDVTAVDIGYKYLDKKNKRTREIAVRIHVKEKKAEGLLVQEEIFKKFINGKPTDVIEANYGVDTGAGARRLSPHRKRFKVIQPGISVGHYKGAAGTIGLIVHNRLSGKAALLSNWHVLCNDGDANVGDPIVQPGRPDGGKHGKDTAAFLLEKFVIDQDGDAAIAEVKENKQWRPGQFPTNARITGIRNPILGEKLVKSGCKTGETYGQVDGIGRYIIDGYPGGPLVLDGFVIGPRDLENPGNEVISGPGDSGSCWHTPDTNEAVGLHCAGENASDARKELGLACFLTRVFDRLDIALYREEKKGGKKMPYNFSVEVTNNLDINRRVVVFGDKKVGRPDHPVRDEYPPVGSAVTEVIVKAEDNTPPGDFNWHMKIRGTDGYEFTRGADVTINGFEQENGEVVYHFSGWSTSWSLKVTKLSSPFRREQSTNVTIGDD